MAALRVHQDNVDQVRVALPLPPMALGPAGQVGAVLAFQHQPLDRGAAGTAELVPVGKAYSGYTDTELLQLDRWIRDHTTRRYGPVREVTPALVFEVAFDSVHPSTRHKSGVAMRFPRIHRIRWDKPAAEADRLESVERLIA